ncbi:MAG: DUF2189 domain-containing protein [Rhodocyclales bacterium]|nr:DUF2189 domain-containing protein [Rhodocyclales bacterium]
METQNQDKHFPVIRSGLPLSAPFEWLRLGWGDLKASGFPSLFYGLCFAAGGLLFFLVFRHAVQLLTALTTGFMLAGPFLAIGLYEISRQHEYGKRPSLKETLVIWRRNLSSNSLYSLILVVLYLLWARASLVAFALFYQGGMPSVESFIAQIMKFDNIDFLLVYLAIGGMFAGLVFALSVVSIPMMLDHNEDTVTAMLASFLAFVRNFPVILVWGALIAALGLIGIATAFVGHIVLMPLIGHATWHAYRALIEPLPPPSADASKIGYSSPSPRQ